jgi:hypothetical protein
MSSYDFDINNYSVDDLEKFLKLGNNYNEKAVVEKANTMHSAIMKSMAASSTKIKTKKMEKELVSFLDEAKRLLIERLAKTRMINMGDDHRQIINKQDAPDSIMSYIQPMTMFPTTVAQGTLNPLKKRITNYSLCMNTLFHDCLGSADGNMMFVLPYPLKKVISLKLASLEFPDTVFMVSNAKKTNRMYIKENVTNLETLIILPDGNYTEQTLPTILQYAINKGLGSENRFRVTIDEISHRMTILNTTNTFSMEFSNQATNPILSKNLGWYMGYRCMQYNNCDAYESEGLFNPVPLPYIYFILNDYNISSSTTIMGFFGDNYLEKNILAKIPIPVNSYQIMFDNNSDLISKKREYFGTVDISKFSIRILDHFGDVVNTNQMDFSFTLELEIAYDI